MIAIEKATTTRYLVVIAGVTGLVRRTAHVAKWLSIHVVRKHWYPTSCVGQELVTDTLQREKHS